MNLHPKYKFNVAIDDAVVTQPILKRKSFKSTEIIINIVITYYHFKHFYSNT